MEYIIIAIVAVIVAVIIIKRKKKQPEQPPQTGPYNPGTGGGPKPDKNEPSNY